jgi:cytochrome c peroxidase
MAMAALVAQLLYSSAFADSLTVSVSHDWSGAPLIFDEAALTNAAGNSLSITRLAYLVSDVTLESADGHDARLAGQFAYLNPAEGHASFTLTNAPPGHYTNISFRIGLDPDVNHRDPSAYPAGNPLNPNLNHLHWNWQGGYVFLALEGLYRRPDGQLGGYSYHLATDAIRMPVSLATDFSIPGDDLALTFDLAKVFNAPQPVRISPEGDADSTHSAPGDPVAPRLANNIVHAISGTAAACCEPVSPAPAVDAVAAAKSPHGTAFALAIPPNFPRPQLPADNPLTVEGVALGKKLFFDPRLSRDESQSCANCHHPTSAFADAGRALSVGVDGLPGKRNAMPLFNLLWQRDFFWDGRVHRLRDQPPGPIQNPLEMHASLAEVTSRLAADPEYPPLFEHAFGATNVTNARMCLALEQYMFTLVSGDSKFDRAARGEAELTAQEQRGLRLFNTEYDPARGKYGADCFHCHGGPLFSDYTFKNNGLDAAPRDAGRFLVTTNAADLGKFKTPSLRNVAVTGPYMHDGRFATLEEAVEHYSTGIQRSDTLDANLAKLPDGGLHLSVEDQQALVAFLQTLTDEQFKTNPAQMSKSR